MSLEQYKQKRTAAKTPEPFGGKPSGKELRFVIQKHAASHLHYDFRLEMDGVLKSWAIPKGPSTDPQVKRLAMMVEDHPYNYRNFEGIIPKGQYGGGTVIVWDEGTYEPVDDQDTDLKERQKELLHQLHSGRLKFVLHGRKLKGSFALVKAQGRGDNGWLLMKLEDRYASDTDVLLKDKSVVSRKTIEQVAKTSTRIYGEPDATREDAATTGTKAKRGTAPVKTAKKKTIGPGPGQETPPGPAQPFYTRLEPMLATLVDKAFDEEGWIYEIKWDGYRAVTFKNEDILEIRSRNDKSFNDKYYPIYQALKSWKVNAIVDGEIVVLNKEGTANFGALQNWRSEADGSLVYYVFDLLWYEGRDLTGLPLTERYRILQSIMPDTDDIRLSTHFETSGIEFLEAAKKMGIEGIMAKRKESLYYAGLRTRDWLKIKANKRQEVVIGGYTINEGTHKPFSALLAGVYEGKRLVYTGKIGTGFNIRQQQEMMAAFKPLITGKIPFDTTPDVNKPSRFRPDPPRAKVYWLKPELICEVSFAELTVDGIMRHPSFEGMRADKKPKSVIMEQATPVGSALKENTKQVRTLLKPAGKATRKTLLNPTDETQVRKVKGHELKFTNLSKVYWPDVQVTKRDMINYYYQVAPFILPYLKDRPQSLNRHPNGIKGKSFYQKDVTGKVPDWMDTYLYHSGVEDVDKHFLVCSDEASLLYMAGLGCIELNPWSSTTEKPDHPDWCIIDLDPDKNSFEQVIEAAQITRQVLEQMKVPCYCKTSGSTGLHVYIPLGAKYTYEQSKEFARIIVTLVHREIPKYTTLERTVSKRKGKMYLDFLQNRPQATIAAPYSLRPKPGATVSMPLHWDEVKEGLQMKDFTIFNAMDRLRETGDLFKPVLGKGIDLNKIIDQFSPEA